MVDIKSLHGNQFKQLLQIWKITEPYYQKQDLYIQRKRNLLKILTLDFKKLTKTEIHY